MRVDYQRFFEKLPGACVVLSPEFRILAVNDAYERASMRSREALVGRVLFETFRDNPDDPGADGVEKLRASLERVKHDCVPDALPVQRYDIEDPARPGVYIERYWSPINTPVCDEQGRVEYIIHLAEDVTEMVLLAQRQAERVRTAEAVIEEEHQRLTESHIALEASNEELEAFCYSVAHDLRAPLRAIQGFSQALVEDHAAALDAKGQDYLARVSHAAVRMSTLIDDLLTLSRISRSPLVRADVDLSALARAVVAGLEGQAEHRPAVAIAGEVRARGDERLLHIALENLFNNAWKFSSKTEDARIEFGVETIDGGRAFFVRDNGAGFDEAYAAKLFAPFQRLHSDREFAGTGIGLATVQRIVRRHGGRIWGRGIVARGATFYFTLPD
jgi:signal transduction histidine kinase